MKTMIVHYNTCTRRAGTGSVRSTTTQKLSRAGLALLAVAFSNCALATPTTVGPTVSFDFNPVSVTQTDSATGMKLELQPGTGSGLGATASSAAISRYMTTTLHNAGYRNSSVDVSGAIGTATYVGEGHVWGDSLGTKDNAAFDRASPVHTSTLAKGKDGFIINNNFGLYTGTASSFFTMNFTNFVVDTVSYDWEIFPDATCPTNGCAVLPDLTLYASGAKIDGTSGKQIASESALRLTNPASGYAPQNMGTSSNINVNGATGLRFQDWPAEIGIDNLVITGHVVPEPATVPLLAGGLMALGWLARRRKHARDS